MQEQQVGIDRRGQFQFFFCFGHFVSVEERLPKNQVVFRRLPADCDHLLHSFFIEFLLTRLYRCDIQQIKIRHIIRFLLPQRLQHLDCLSITLREDLAKPQKVARLLRTRVFA